MNYGIGEQLIDLWKILLAALVMFWAVQAMNLQNCSIIILLVYKILVGIIAYIGMGYVFKLEQQTYLIQMISNTIRKRK